MDVNVCKNTSGVLASKLLWCDTIPKCDMMKWTAYCLTIVCTLTAIHQRQPSAPTLNNGYLSLQDDELSSPTIVIQISDQYSSQKNIEDIQRKAKFCDDNFSWFMQTAPSTADFTY
jgi:hypothetical protein